MYSILKSTMNGTYDHSPSDPWRFTDPCGRDLYMQRDLIDQLEPDIRTYGMFDGCWAWEELDYKLEVRRLLREGIIAPMGSFGSLRCLSQHLHPLQQYTGDHATNPELWKQQEMNAKRPFIGFIQITIHARGIMMMFLFMRHFA